MKLLSLLILIFSFSAIAESRDTPSNEYFRSKKKKHRFNNSYYILKNPQEKKSYRVQIKTKANSYYVIVNEKEVTAHYVAKHGLLPILKHLLDKDKRLLNSTDRHGKTLLHYATQHGRDLTVDYLLRKGADTQIKDKDGKIPSDYNLKQTSMTKKMNPSRLQFSCRSLF